MSQAGSMPDGRDFTDLTEPYRRELTAHCYRLLGSADDAEDLVQETYLRAWRSFDKFQGRSSVRTWLYRIATNACLTALRRRPRRVLPSGLRGAGEGVDLSSQPPDVCWLQPIPDAMVTAENSDPAAIAVRRESLRLALVASLQYLPPRQRAVLILRDVLAFPATEAAGILGTTTAAVQSALQRARTRLEQVSPAADQLTEPSEPQARAVLDRYIAAFENADARALKDLLHSNATLELPPSPVWYAGDDAAAGAIAGLGSPGDWLMLPTAANGQPAAGVYLRDAEGTYRGYGVVVLTTTRTGIAAITGFADQALLARFGLPPVYLKG